MTHIQKKRGQSELDAAQQREPLGNVPAAKQGGRNVQAQDAKRNRYRKAGQRSQLVDQDSKARKSAGKQVGRIHEALDHESLKDRADHDPEDGKGQSCLFVLDRSRIKYIYHNHHLHLV